MISKLDPRHTLALRGFDDRGAAAALHQVTADSWKLTGVFRDPADFTVLMLYDADNFYEHPKLKYLPDFSFEGVVLTFDLASTGVQPIESAKFPTIDWPYLDVVKADGTTAKIRLFDHATQVGGLYTKAETRFTIGGTNVAFARLTIWYQNFAFDWIAAGTETLPELATILAGQINAAAYGAGIGLEATALGADVVVRCTKAGDDGNHIGLYAQASNGTLTITPATAILSGGKSEGVWRVSLDFAALGLSEIRQMWLTFAPALAYGVPYQDTEFEVTASNWTVAGPKELRIAGPGSVRIEETDSWCSYEGSSWGSEAGFYSKGFARRATSAGDKVTIKYSCQFEHDLYVGTALYSDRGGWMCTLDGDVATALDCHLEASSQVVTRRKIRTAVPPGEHVVVLEADGAGPVYFDFLEAAVLADDPAPAVELANECPAMDYGTDHTYKLSAARTLDGLEALGYRGDLNVYVSVFWWNQRKLSGRVLPSVSIDFTGVAVSGRSVFIDISGFTLGKSVFPADTDSSIALHFFLFLNSSSSGLYAELAGTVLTLHPRSVGAAYEFAVTAWHETPPSLTRTAIPTSGSLSGGVYGTWVVDPAAEQAINAGTRAWLEDLCAECAARGRGLTLAYSMELLNPPDEWAARYADGTAVTTATGFATNVTTHCSFVSGMLAYQKQVFAETAAIQAAAGLPVRLQVGEFLWWFFPGNGPFDSKGMAFYDAETSANALAALGRPLATFTTPDDDPSVNGYADANFLASTLVNYISALSAHVKSSFSSAQIEILLPFDVNYPVVAGVNNLGGKLNHYVNIPTAFYDPSTAPFDLVKMEALDWQVGTRSQSLALETMRWPYVYGSWPRGKSRFLVGLFNGGAPWLRALRQARWEGLAGINYWAWDHVCIFGWDPNDDITETVQVI